MLIVDKKMVSSVLCSLLKSNFTVFVICKHLGSHINVDHQTFERNLFLSNTVHFGTDDHKLFFLWGPMVISQVDIVYKTATRNLEKEMGNARWQHLK